MNMSINDKLAQVNKKVERENSAYERKIQSIQEHLNQQGAFYNNDLVQLEKRIEKLRKQKLEEAE